MKPKTKGGAILKNRREKALQRLENQLKANKKPQWSEELQCMIAVKLETTDVTRINKEIETLKTRIK